MKKTGLVIAAVFLAAALAFAGGSKDSKKTVVTVGITGQDFIASWQPAIKALAAEGIELQLKEFADYTILNQALNDGEIDLNAFQHNAFLEAEIAARHFDLTPLGDTIISVMGVYSTKIKSLDELKNGDSVVVPNDPTNGGRALRVFESAGVFKIDPAKGYLPTPADIIDNPKNIKVIEVDAAQVLRALPDAAAGVANSNYAVDAGLNPLTDSIYLKPIDPVTDKPYINVLVARTKEKNNPLYLKVLKAFQTKETADATNAYYNGSTIPAFKY